MEQNIEPKSLITTKTDVWIGYILSLVLLVIGFAFSAIENSLAYATSIFFVTAGCMIFFYVYISSIKIYSKLTK